MDKALAEDKIDAMAGPLRILEAGCGRRWPLNLTVQHELIGIDLDAEAMAARQDLDAAILGDLRNHEFPDSSFDVIYCSYVLEHVPGAARVMANFSRWMRPGGLLIIEVPDPDSVFGWATRHTPHWFHVLFKRHIMRQKHAGETGYGPYRTYYDGAISEAGVRGFCRAHGLQLEHVQRTGDYLRGRFVKQAAIILHYLSLRSLPWKHNNICYFIRSPVSPAAMPAIVGGDIREEASN